MVLEVQSSFPHHILAVERGLNSRSFDSHMRSKLLQCSVDTRTLYDTRPCMTHDRTGGVTRLDSAQDKKQVWRPHVPI